MNRNRRKEFRVLAGEIKDVLIWNVKGAQLRQCAPRIVVDHLLGKDHHGAERRGADKFEKPFHIEAVKVSSKSSAGQSHMLEHQRGHGPAPRADAYPATTPARTVSNNMHMHVNWLAALQHRVNVTSGHKARQGTITNCLHGVRGWRAGVETKSTPTGKRPLHGLPDHRPSTGNPPME